MNPEEDQMAQESEIIIQDGYLLEEEENYDDDYDDDDYDEDYP
jgi:hypothetical protein